MLSCAQFCDRPTPGGHVRLLLRTTRHGDSDPPNRQGANSDLLPSLCRRAAPAAARHFAHAHAHARRNGDFLSTTAEREGAHTWASPGAIDDPRKNARMLTEALTLCSNRGLDLTLHLIGSEASPELEAFTAGLDMVQHVEFRLLVDRR